MSPQSPTSPSGNDPRDPKTILQTSRQAVRHFIDAQLPNLLDTLADMPSRAGKRYAERDRTYDARKGPIGDPFRGWVDPGLNDGIEERKKAEEELRKKRNFS